MTWCRCLIAIVHVQCSADLYSNMYQCTLHLGVPVSLHVTDLDESGSSFIDDNHDMNVMGDTDEWPFHECANCIVHKREIGELKES